MQSRLYPETLYVTGYWGARHESALDCARRAHRFFQALAGCDPALREWYTSGRRAKGTPGVPVATADVAELEKRFLKGRNYTDRNRRVIEDLGFFFYLWNAEQARARVQFICGASCQMPPNSCVIDPPREGETAQRLLSLPMLVQLLRVVVEAWEPDSGVVASDDHSVLTSKQFPGAPRVGWVTYLSHRLGPVPPLPAEIRVEPVGSQGTLLLLPVERFTVDDPEHVALAASVRERLAGAGLRWLHEP